MSFKELSKTVSECQEIRDSEVRKRHNLVYRIAGSWYDEVPGTICIERNGETYRFKSKNVARRLNEIFTDLTNGSRSCKQIAALLDSFDDEVDVAALEKLNIVIEEGNSLIQRYAARLPNKCHGMYLLTFPNGKIYVGVSKDVKQRVLQHIKGLFQLGGKQLSWYDQVRKENDLVGFESVQVEYAPLDQDSVELHELIEAAVTIGEKESYNITFPKEITKS